MKKKIYMLPGLMTDERLWSRLEDYLEDYELVHIQIPNYESFDEINSYLEKQFKEEKVNLLGFSLGSYIVSYYALKNPSKVRGVFNVSGTPSGTKESEIEKRKKKVQFILNNGFAPLGRKKAISLLEEENRQDEELIQVVQDMYDDLGGDTFICQMNSTFERVDIFEELKKLNIPIYYYYSKNDRLLNKKSIEEHLLSDGHNMKVVSREGTSHNIPLEAPLSLSLEIKKWFKEKAL